MGFFSTLSLNFETMLSFFPSWFVYGFTSILTAFGLWALISLVLKLKDLFWPF